MADDNLEDILKGFHRAHDKRKREEESEDQSETSLEELLAEMKIPFWSKVRPILKVLATSTVSLAALYGAFHLGDNYDLSLSLNPPSVSIERETSYSPLTASELEDNVLNYSTFELHVVTEDANYYNVGKTFYIPSNIEISATIDNEFFDYNPISISTEPLNETDYLSARATFRDVPTDSVVRMDHSADGYVGGHDNLYVSSEIAPRVDAGEKHFTIQDDEGFTTFGSQFLEFSRKRMVQCLCSKQRC
jgi:hypothetical protein